GRSGHRVRQGLVRLHPRHLGRSPEAVDAGADAVEAAVAPSSSPGPQAGVGEHADEYGVSSVRFRVSALSFCLLRGLSRRRRTRLVWVQIGLILWPVPLRYQLGGFRRQWRGGVQIARPSLHEAASLGRRERDSLELIEKPPRPFDEEV